VAGSAYFRGLAVNAYVGTFPRMRRGLRRLGKAVVRTRPKATFYYQADDATSHLMAQALVRLRREIGLAIEWVVVPPASADFDPEPELRAKHAARDAATLAGHYDLDFPDPWELPAPDRVRRASAVLLVPRPIDEQLAAALRIGEALWRGDGNALAEAVHDLGAVAGQDVRPSLEASYAELRRAGYYAGSVVRYGGAWYAGVDRLQRLAEHVAADVRRADPPEVLRARPESERAGETDVLLENGRVPLEVFFSYRSPYSYLALPQVRRLTEALPIALRLRPVLPMAMRGLPVPQTKARFLARDARLEAERHGIPFGRICDPLGVGTERCLAVHVALAAPAGKDLDFAESATRGIWSEAVDVSTDDGIARVAERAGLDPEEAIAAASDPRWREVVEHHLEDLLELGLWGVPSFRLGTFATWGQDRIPILEDRIRRRLRS
jgi:2-hydroxychromene-2-carboxylate isomerase